MLAIQRVNAAAFAQEAAHILEEAWPPPALHYTREYLRWQMTFPSDVDAIGVAAMDGREPVGFIGASPRRMRSGGESFTCFIVSFVAVRPKWRNRRVASALYAALLHEIRAARIATITFALPQSTGERLLLREYANGGFAIIPLGAYHTYAYRARGEDNSQYDVFTSEDPRLLCEAIAYCSADDSLIWNDPTTSQVKHYVRDPRPRKLLVLREQGAVRGAAWALRMDYRTARSIETVTTLESVFLPRSNVSALKALLEFAARLWGTDDPSAIVGTPSLCGFDAAQLRSANVRQTGPGFNAYYCEADRESMPLLNGTNLEIV